MPTLLQEIYEQRARAREAARAAAYRELRDALSRLLPPGTEVWVFGSVLKPGRFREHSDLDIAIESLPRGSLGGMAARRARVAPSARRGCPQPE